MSTLGGYGRKRFRKGLARAGGRITEEATNLDEQSNGASLAGQIRKPPGVTTMNAARGLTTIRTRNFREGRFDDHYQDAVLVSSSKLMVKPQERYFEQHFDQVVTWQVMEVSTFP
jgi:hypothetical protein